MDLKKDGLMQGSGVRTMVGLLCVLLGWAGVRAQAATLVQDGASDARILLPAEPWPVEELAAKELQYHLAKASGAQLPIVRGGEPRAGQTDVWLGRAARPWAPALTEHFVAPNQYVLRVVEGQLLLAGDDTDGPPLGLLDQNRTRIGTLMAVHAFLRDQMGVRWIWPGTLGEVIPRQATVRVDDTLDRVVEPPFAHTRFRISEHFLGVDAAWSSPQARQDFADAQSLWLRRHGFVMGQSLNMGHAFSRWWDRFGETRPDFFSLLPDGSRGPDPRYRAGRVSLVALCVSNPDVHQQIVADWLERRGPEDRFLVISENDTAGKCLCERCLAWDVPDPSLEVPWEERVTHARQAFDDHYGEAHEISDGKMGWEHFLGSMSDRYARFALAVQALAEQAVPEVVILTYAYANYYRAPLATTLNDRIVVGFVPPGYFPWTPQRRADYREQWHGWRRSGVQLFLRPNWTLDGHVFPVFVARDRGEDLRYFAAQGMLGFDFDSLTGQYAAQGPDLYQIARFASDPTESVEDALADFWAAFGPAASAIQAYFDHWEAVTAAVTERPKGLRGWGMRGWQFYPRAHVIFTPDAIARGEALLEDARRQAQGDAQIQARCDFLKLGLEQAARIALVQRAEEAWYDQPSQEGVEAFSQAVGRLQAFRREHDVTGFANVGFFYSSEALDRRVETLRREQERSATLLAPEAEATNRLTNPGFEQDASGWRTNTQAGALAYAWEPEGLWLPGALRITASTSDAERSWGRWFQREIPVKVGAPHRLRVWFRTSEAFSGRVEIWLRNSPQARANLMSTGTGGQWQMLEVKDWVPEADHAELYLNVTHGVGTVWFDHVELVTQDEL